MSKPAHRLPSRALSLLSAAWLTACAATTAQSAPEPAHAAPQPSSARATAAAPATQQGKQPFASLLDALRASSVLSGRSGPASVNWIDDGDRFSYSVRNPQTRREEVRIYEPATGTDSLLFDPKNLTLPGTGQPLEYRAFQWAHDSRHLLFQTDFRPIYRRSGIADYYLYSLADHSLQLAAKDARTAELSPDGRLVGYERGGDMFVYDLAAKKETQLTTGATDSVFNGVYDWVYEEEFGEAQAWKWSPDSRRIAFWQTDESAVPIVQLTDWAGTHPEWEKIPIPNAGDPNPAVRIGVANVNGGGITWLDTGLKGDFYIPRIYWTSDPDTLAVVTLDRLQNHVRLFFFDVKTGARRQVFEETSDTWIDVYDFYAGIDDFFYFPQHSREFFWVSDRTGHQHLYRYGYDGTLKNQVTHGNYTVTRVEAIDPAHRTVYYTSTEASPLQRQLYAIDFDGTHQRRLSQAPGHHRFDMGPNGRYYIDRYSSTEHPQRVELWSTAKGRLATLEDNQQTTDWLKTHLYSPTEIFQFTTSDSVTLDASMIRPPDFDPSKTYPVVMSIYGGPGSQQVYDAFAANGFDQYLAQQGFIVVGLNNRGANNYSRDFMKVVYGHLGRWESHDFVELARYLAAKPWVDADHMAIMGTSYGGYSTVYTMLRHPGVFRLGMANSPVTDWRLYDSIYTERYMGMPQSNPDGYKESAATPLADNLQGHLLLVHSGMDDNVHPRNTMQLLTALATAGKDAEVRFYPPGAHGAVFNSASYILLLRVYENELCRYLEPACAVGLLNK
ncbi:MAG TPA: S9 family peptidase [Longimicrobiales bacterium]|nr:S9 family peptidase [Longimicrobiales bacterium]